MKNTRLPFIAALLLTCCSPVPAFSQNAVKGKIYKAKISESCGRTTTGGCTTYTYQFLNFSNDSVAISYDTKAICYPKTNEEVYEGLRKSTPNTHPYKVVRNNIIIQNCTLFDALVLRDYGLESHKKGSKDLLFRVEKPGGE